MGRQVASVSVVTNFETRLVVTLSRGQAKTFGDLRAMIKALHVSLFPERGNVDIISLEVLIETGRNRLHDSVRTDFLFERDLAVMYAELRSSSANIPLDLQNAIDTTEPNAVRELEFQDEQLMPSPSRTRSNVEGKKKSHLEDSCGLDLGLAMKRAVSSLAELSDGSLQGDCKVSPGILERRGSQNLDSSGRRARKKDQMVEGQSHVNGGEKVQGEMSSAGFRSRSQSGHKENVGNPLDMLSLNPRALSQPRGDKEYKGDSSDDSRKCLSFHPVAESVGKNPRAVRSKNSYGRLLAESSLPVKPMHNSGTPDGSDSRKLSDLPVVDEAKETGMPVELEETTMSPLAVETGPVMLSSVYVGDKSSVVLKVIKKPKGAENSRIGSQSADQSGEKRKRNGNGEQVSNIALGDVQDKRDIRSPSVQDPAVPSKSGSLENTGTNTRRQDLCLLANSTLPGTTSKRVVQSEITAGKKSMNFQQKVVKPRVGDSYPEEPRKSSSSSQSLEGKGLERVSNRGSPVLSSDQSYSADATSSNDTSDGSADVQLRVKPRITSCGMRDNDDFILRTKSRRNFGESLDFKYQHLIDSQDGFDELINLSQQKLKVDECDNSEDKLPLANDTHLKTVGRDAQAVVRLQDSVNPLFSDEGIMKVMNTTTVETSHANKGVLEKVSNIAEISKNGEENSQHRSNLPETIKPGKIDELLFVKPEPTLAAGSSVLEAPTTESDDPQQLRAAVQLARMSMTKTFVQNLAEKSPLKKVKMGKKKGLTPLRAVVPSGLEPQPDVSPTEGELLQIQPKVIKGRENLPTKARSADENKLSKKIPVEDGMGSEVGNATEFPVQANSSVVPTCVSNDEPAIQVNIDRTSSFHLQDLHKSHNNDGIAISSKPVESQTLNRQREVPTPLNTLGNYGIVEESLPWDKSQTCKVFGVDTEIVSPQAFSKEKLLDSQECRIGFSQKNLSDSLGYSVDLSQMNIQDSDAHHVQLSPRIVPDSQVDPIELTQQYRRDTQTDSCQLETKKVNDKIAEPRLAEGGSKLMNRKDSLLPKILPDHIGQVAQSVEVSKEGSGGRLLGVEGTRTTESVGVPAVEETDSMVLQERDAKKRTGQSNMGILKSTEKSGRLKLARKKDLPAQQNWKDDVSSLGRKAQDDVSQDKTLSQGQSMNDQVVGVVPVVLITEKSDDLLVDKKSPSPNTKKPLKKSGHISKVRKRKNDLQSAEVRDQAVLQTETGGDEGMLHCRDSPSELEQTTLVSVSAKDANFPEDVSSLGLDKLAVEGKRGEEIEMPRLSEKLKTRKKRPKLMTAQKLGPLAVTKEDSATEAGAKEAGAKEAGAKKVGAKEAGAKAAGAKEAGAKEAGAKETGAKEAGTEKAGGAKETDARDTDARETDARETDAKEACSKETDPVKADAKKMAVPELRNCTEEDHAENRPISELKFQVVPDEKKRSKKRKISLKPNVIDRNTEATEQANESALKEGESLLQGNATMAPTSLEKVQEVTGAPSGRKKESKRHEDKNVDCHVGSKKKDVGNEPVKLKKSKRGDTGGVGEITEACGTDKPITKRNSTGRFVRLDVDPDLAETCPHGCGRVYTTKTSAYFRHLKSCYMLQKS